MSKFKLTKAGRAVVGVVLAVAVAIGVVGGIKGGLIKFDKKKPTASKPSTSISTDKPSNSAGDDTINLSLDEWAGWLSCITANGGLTTQPGSVFDQLGIKVNINVINDATESSNALISGDLQAAGYTTNRVAFLSQKFTDAGKNVIMPIFTNYSYGGDGIIASTQFADVNSWVNAKIGVPEFSEAEGLGETVNRDLVNTLFDTTYIDALKSDFKSTSAANATTKVTVSDETRANITQQVTGNLDYDSMLSKTANVTFVPDSSVFTDQASAASVLNDFVNIAKTLDGTMIVINGNINANNQTEFGVQLSANRAQTVANYLASQGIDQNRLIVTGSGNAKYQADKAAGTLSDDASVYQSTDISFMRIEN